MGVRNYLAAVSLAALAGCGGSIGVGVGIGAVFVDDDNDDELIVWGGNASRDRVVDASNRTFAFFAADGCLFNFQTGRENPHFCLTAGGNTALYGALRARVANIRSSAGSCIAALVDEVTGNLIDLTVDAYGREVAVVTALHPAFCGA